MDNIVIIGGQWHVPDEDYPNGFRPVGEQERMELINGER